MDDFFEIIWILFWPAAIIGLIVFFVRRRTKKTVTEDKEWYLRIALSKEDAVSQLFLLMSFGFLGVMLLSLNRDLGGIFSWRTVILITSLLGLASAYYLKTIYTLVFGLVGFTSWWGAQAAEWSQGKDLRSSTILSGMAFLILLFYVLGHLHEREERFRRFAMVYSVLGIFSMTGILFFLSTKSGVRWLGELTRGGSSLASWEISLSIFLFFVAVMAAAGFSLLRGLMRPAEISVVAALSGLFAIISIMPEQLMFLPYDRYSYGVGELSGVGILWAIVFNLVVFLELLGLILSGYVRHEVWLVNMGALFLFLLIVVKYFDWFFTFMDKSVFFIGAGVLLFLVGWSMEKGRRYVIHNLQNQSRIS